MSPSADFKSAASADSATAPNGLIVHDAANASSASGEIFTTPETFLTMRNRCPQLPGFNQEQFVPATG
jgi:hypothetical protein